ncbi:hypothetical protein FOZ62_030308, partial [Perkinsus olseni]
MGSLRCEVCNSLNKSRSEDSYSNNANTLGNSEVRCINTTYLMDLNHSVMSELMLNVFDNWVEVYRSLFSFGERLDRIHLKLKERLNVNWMELVVKDSEEIKSLLSDAGAAQCWAPVGLSRSGMGDVVLIALRLGGPRDVSFSDNHARGMRLITAHTMGAREPLKMMRDLGSFMKDGSSFATLYELGEVYREVTKLENIDEASRVVVLSKLIEALGRKKFLLRYHSLSRCLKRPSQKYVNLTPSSSTRLLRLAGRKILSCTTSRMG